jgi:K+-sensing histidine kinase KdpD
LYLGTQETKNFDEEAQIEEHYSKYIIENYLPKLKIVFPIVIVLLSIVTYILGAFIEQKPIVAIFINRIKIFNALLLASIFLVHFYPKNCTIIVPVFIGTLMEFTTAFSMNTEAYPCSEAIIPSISFWFTIIVIFPGRMKANMFVFWLGWVYYFYRLHTDRGMMTIVYVLWGFMSVIYFIISSFLSYVNLKSLNKEIYQNKKQARETQRLLEVFPHGVIIRSGDCEMNFRIDFTNNEFNQQIHSIRNMVKKLKEVDVIDEECKTSLHDFLCSKESDLVGDEVIEQKKLTVKYQQNEAARSQPHPSRENFDEKWDQVFTVRSIKVDWNGKTSYMHVFFVNNDILRLEEANNNIKLQKIMFASVSHEFRTPLNAIIHSYHLSSISFDNLMHIFESLLNEGDKEWVF